MDESSRCNSPARAQDQNLLRHVTCSCLQGSNIAAIVAPPVVIGVVVIAMAVVARVLYVVKKKRQTEGTYRPSAEEQSGASCVAATHDLKLPKEERLI